MLLNQKTTIGKTVKVALWVALSGAVSSLIAYVAKLDTANLAWLLPAVNTALVFLKNLADKNVKNV